MKLPSVRTARGRRSWWASACWGTALVAIAASLAGCGTGAKAAATTAGQHGQLAVVASTWPLAQLAKYIGGPEVKVVDLAADGAQPQGMALDSAQRRELAGAGLAVYVGDGYQSQVEELAVTDRHHLALLPAVSKVAQPYEFWLDPNLMGQAALDLAKAMSAADPSAAARFGDGGRDFQAVTVSVGSDYVNSLSTCTGHQFMTADNAFSRLASTYSLQDLAISALGAKKADALVASDKLSAVFTEEGVAAGLLQVVASSAGVAVKTLDPMEVVPFTGTARENTWFSVMERNLQSLEGPLACDTSELFS